MARPVHLAVERPGRRGYVRRVHGVEAAARCPERSAWERRARLPSPRDPYDRRRFSASATRWRIAIFT